MASSDRSGLSSDVISKSPGAERGESMRRILRLSLTILACAAPAPVFAQSADVPPAWAYPMNPPGFKPPLDDGTLRHVAGSTLSLTLSQVNNPFFASDWHPEDHPSLPGVVADGRKPGVLACGFCHRADGPGGPESAKTAFVSSIGKAGSR